MALLELEQFDNVCLLQNVLKLIGEQLSGPRARRPKKVTNEKSTSDEKRPRTAFSGPQLARLKVSAISIIYTL